jgi:hypothetical protein
MLSTCSGKRIMDTIAEIESGKITAKDLPQVTVIQDLEGNTYCMNNRRLYVFKHIRRMGLLEGNKVNVRVKIAIPRELVRYTPEKCSLNCVILREKAAWDLEKDDHGEEGAETAQKEEATQEKEETGSATAATAAITTPEVKSAEVASGGVNFKNNKKKLQAVTGETDEDRYARQKQKIAEAKEMYEKQAAERLKRRQEKEALLKASGATEQSDSESDEDEEEDEEDLFICNLCRYVGVEVERNGKNTVS